MVERRVTAQFLNVDPTLEFTKSQQLKDSSKDITSYAGFFEFTKSQQLKDSSKDITSYADFLTDILTFYVDFKYKQMSYQEELEFPVTKLEHIDIKEIHDDLLNGCGKKALEVFNNIRVSVEDGLNHNNDFINELSKLDELQNVFGILKSTDYEKNTLNYQIYDRIQNRIVNLANKIKNRDEDIDVLFSEIAEILQTYSKTKGVLKETGIDKLSTLKDLGIKIGEKKVFQIE